MLFAVLLVGTPRASIFGCIIGITEPSGSPEIDWEGQVWTVSNGVDSASPRTKLEARFSTASSVASGEQTRSFFQGRRVVLVLCTRLYLTHYLASYNASTSFPFPFQTCISVRTINSMYATTTAFGTCPRVIRDL